MIIEDQAPLGRAIRRMLATHDVTVVETGREALELIESGERFDVILSDLMLPEITGMDLHEILQRVAPEQVDKMVFMTGGAFTDKSRAFFDHVPNPTIEKPFDRAALFSVIEGLLR